MRLILTILFVALFSCKSSDIAIVTEVDKVSDNKQEYIPMYRGEVIDVTQTNKVYSYKLKINRLDKDIYIVYITNDKYKIGDFIHFKTDMRLDKEEGGKKSKYKNK